MNILAVPTVEVSETITQTDTIVTIYCSANVTQDSPALTAIHWLLNGANLSFTDNTKYSGGNLNIPSLTINNIGPKDAGVYHCVATNPVGPITSSQSVNLGKTISIVTNRAIFQP